MKGWDSRIYVEDERTRKIEVTLENIRDTRG